MRRFVHKTFNVGHFALSKVRIVAQFAAFGAVLNIYRSCFALKIASVVLILSAFVAALAAAHLTAVLSSSGFSLLLVLLSFLHDFNLLFRLLVLCDLRGVLS